MYFSMCFHTCISPYAFAGNIICMMLKCHLKGSKSKCTLTNAFIYLLHTYDYHGHGKMNKGPWHGPKIQNKCFKTNIC